MCYISASIGKKVFVKIVLCDKNAAENGDLGSFPQRIFLWQRPLERRKTPSRTP